jgi:hypothetical protein
MPNAARCACGSTKISVSGDLVAHAVCHCDNCKQRTGSAFGISAYFRRSDVTSIEGEMAVYSLHNEKRNEDQERHFCKKCGTTLFWYMSRYPDFIGIAGGCFTEPLGEPKINSSASKKLSWVVIPEHWQLSE